LLSSVFLELEIVFNLLAAFFKFKVELFRANDIFSLVYVHHLPHCDFKVICVQPILL